MRFAIGLAVATACVVAHANAQNPARPAQCPPVPPDTASHRMAQVFIDGRPVGKLVTAKREGTDPESYEITDPEPPELAKLPVARIDLIQYLRGADPERQYRLCPGTVAIVITTKKR